MLLLLLLFVVFTLYTSDICLNKFLCLIHFVCNIVPNDYFFIIPLFFSSSLLWFSFRFFIVRIIWLSLYRYTLCERLFSCVSLQRIIFFIYHLITYIQPQTPIQWNCRTSCESNNFPMTVFSAVIWGLSSHFDYWEILLYNCSLIAQFLPLVTNIIFFSKSKKTNYITKTASHFLKKGRITLSTAFCASFLPFFLPCTTTHALFIQDFLLCVFCVLISCNRFWVKTFILLVQALFLNFFLLFFSNFNGKNVVKFVLHTFRVERERI